MRANLRLLGHGLLASFLALHAPARPVEMWLTSPRQSVLFQRQDPLPVGATTVDGPTVRVDRAHPCQTMDGFGWCLTGGSAQHLMRMSPPARAALLRELFDATGTNIGASYLRLTIGASDLNEKVFSYDDLPPGQVDPQLDHFSLGPDLGDVIPVLREILAVNPAVKFMASPWSPPPWMKTNGDTRGGSLKPEFYDAYARYFVRYLQEMRKQGITIDALTIQNEPLHPGNNPSLKMEAAEQALFIKSHLGPALHSAGLGVKIVCYDHNADRPDYPLSIFDDAGASPFVEGAAFHLYAGTIDVLSKVHEAHPEKSLYFTEQWVGGPGNLAGDLAWHTRTLIIGAPRNWCRVVLEWNLASDPRYQPHTDRGGCDRCLGAVTIDGDRVTRNPAYYIIAHASKFVRPGSTRLLTPALEALPNVVFQTPGGRTVVVVMNPGSTPRRFNLVDGGTVAVTALAGGAVASLVW